MADPILPVSPTEVPMEEPAEDTVSFAMPRAAFDQLRDGVQALGSVLEAASPAKPTADESLDTLGAEIDAQMPVV